MLKKYFLFVILLVLLTCLAFQFCYGSIYEDFQTIGTVPLTDTITYTISDISLNIPADKSILPGYYNYNNIKMYKYPGNNTITPYPTTSVLQENLLDGYFKVIRGATLYLAKLPAGYYQVSDASMARLPTNGSVSPIPQAGYRIPRNYYRIKINPTTLNEDTSQPSFNYIAPIPYGYYYDSNDNKLKPRTNTAAESLYFQQNNDNFRYTAREISNNLDAAKDTRTNYDATNMNVQYHDTTEDIINQQNSGSNYPTGFGEMLVKNQRGELVNVPYVPGQALPVYFKPGSYLYDVKYIPNYEDSIYLSRTTGISTLGKAYPTTDMLGGFCNSLKNDKTAMELKCNSISADQCASTDCCVLFGGTKCVAGNEKGPTFKSNYTDLYVQNRDSYYHKGLCYGNCE
jgi:hypothetical protein